MTLDTIIYQRAKFVNNIYDKSKIFNLRPYSALPRILTKKVDCDKIIINLI